MQKVYAGSQRYNEKERLRIEREHEQFSRQISNNAAMKSNETMIWCIFLYMERRQAERTKARIKRGKRNKKMGGEGR